MVGNLKTQRRAFEDANYESAISMVRGAFGEDAVLRLIEEFGTEGRVYVPQQPTGGSAICRALTLDQALRLSAVFGGESLELPLLRGRRLAQRIEGLLSAGKRPAQIARDLDCSRRTVHKVKKRLAEVAG